MKRLLTAFIVSTALTMLVSGCAAIRTTADVEKYKVKAAAGDDKSVETLLGAFGSREAGIRNAAYSAVIAVGEPAVPRLLVMLNDKKPDMREYAAGALGNIGDHRAVAPLLAKLDAETERRYVYAWALGQLRATEAIEKLIRSLAIKNDALQKESTRALIKIAEPAVPELIFALDNAEPDVRKYAARALGIIEDKAAEGKLIKLLGDDKREVAAAAALALGTAGTKDAVRPLINALNAPDMNTKINASIALGQLNAKDAVDPLTDIMEKDGDPYVRQWCARALENITGNRYKYRDEHDAMVFPYNLYR
ncbi:MAG: HEAT repeat domain-containing protein [Nitrospirae bacterium]|nr:HEAT repeat domain-containing protein [Nitrospirota bacterium]